VKGIQFQNLRDVGSPAELASRYEAEGADEIVLLDVAATVAGRANQAETVRSVRETLSIPLTVGGGVRNAADARRLLEHGADKVSVNSAAVDRPELLEEMAKEFGAQCTILAVDAIAVGVNSWEVVVQAGRIRSGRDVVNWCVEATGRGIGEILLTSWDRDGTRTGYGLDLIAAVSAAVSVPVIASGGASEPRHLLEALAAGADAVLAASIFHTGEFTARQIKDYLSRHQIEVRT
jgi:imidazoleglycerol phosphate synthase cyclase subunit